MSVNHRLDGKPSTGHSECECYRVEARMADEMPPRTIGGNVVDGVWRDLRFDMDSPIGVPVRLFNREAEGLGYLSYEAAMSLAWWFAALAGASAVEVRLARYKFVYNYTITVEAVEDPIVHGAYRYQAQRMASAAR